MPSTGQENLETVMIDFFGALRRGDFDAAGALLDPGVEWQGLREEWACKGRQAVIETFRWGLEQRREIDALEFTRGRDQVVMGARGASITDVGAEPLEGQMFNVFTHARPADRAHRRLPAPRRGAHRGGPRRRCRLALREAFAEESRGRDSATAVKRKRRDSNARPPA